MLNYKSQQAAEYFSSNRIRLEEFYPSEKKALRIMLDYVQYKNEIFHLVDLGCGAGGLGNALLSEDKSNKLRYTGIDINEITINKGKEIFPSLNLINDDIVSYLSSSASAKNDNSKVDLFTSLSCIDWNTEFQKSIDIIAKESMKNNSDFLFTFRASEKGIDCLSTSYQYVNYFNSREGEIAAYVVLSYQNLLELFLKFQPKRVFLFTNDGPPSQTAITPYSKLTFGCAWLVRNDNDYFTTLQFKKKDCLGSELKVHGSYSSSLFRK